MAIVEQFRISWARTSQARRNAYFILVPHLKREIDHGDWITATIDWDRWATALLNYCKNSPHHWFPPAVSAVFNKCGVVPQFQQTKDGKWHRNF
jgi:hypothetical protein